jgi:hypothetical protein
MKDSLPWGPRVVAALQKHGIAVVVPCFQDHLTFLKALSEEVFRPRTWRGSYLMSLSPINQQRYLTKKADLDKEIELHNEKIVRFKSHPLSRSEVADLLERQWAQMLGRKPPHWLSHAATVLYFKDMSAKEEGKGIQFFPKFDKQKADNLQQNQGQAKSFKNPHPLYQDAYALHPLSLAKLSNSDFDGVGDPYVYMKIGFQFFNLHVEQLLLLFVRHQLLGESVWYAIAFNQSTQQALCVK